MTGNRQITKDNRKGAKSNSLGKSMTLLGKRVRYKGKGQCPIDEEQPQYHAHVRCDVNWKQTLGFSQFGPKTMTSQW